MRRSFKHPVINIWNMEHNWVTYRKEMQLSGGSGDHLRVSRYSCLKPMPRWAKVLSRLWLSSWAYRPYFLEERNHVIGLRVVRRILWSFSIATWEQLYRDVRTSQSISNPSKPKSWTSWTAEDANRFRPAPVLNGLAKLAEYDHPPTERSTLSFRFFCLRRKSCFVQP